MASKKSTSATKGKSIRCRFCGQNNSVREGARAKAVCGKCKLQLSDEPHKKFADLTKHDYVHPADSKALAALRAVPGVDSGLRKLLEVSFESIFRVTLTASSVKVSPKQFPD